MCASLRLSISELLSLHMNPPLVLPYVLYAVNNDSSMQDGLSLVLCVRAETTGRMEHSAKPSRSGFTSPMQMNSMTLGK